MRTAAHANRRARPYNGGSPRPRKEEAMPPAETWSVTARWVLPVDAPPLPGGVVVVAGERLAAVEARGGRRPDVDLGNAVILPGLVNAHTHLDLSGFREPLS